MQGNKRYLDNTEPSIIRLVVPSASSKPQHLPYKDRRHRPPLEAKSTLPSIKDNSRNISFRDSCLTCDHCLLSSLPIAIWRHQSGPHNSQANQARQYHPSQEDWSPLNNRVDVALSTTWEEDHLLDIRCHPGCEREDVSSLPSIPWVTHDEHKTYYFSHHNGSAVGGPPLVATSIITDFENINGLKKTKKMS